jgi:hypothetical protein
MSRLLVLCRRPYHVDRAEGEAWLRRELEAVLRRDRLHGARLTGLENAGEWSTRNWDWLIELHVDDRSPPGSLSDRGACGELLADMRLLGMRPTVALAPSREAIELPRA